MVVCPNSSLNLSKRDIAWQPRWHHVQVLLFIHSSLLRLVNFWVEFWKVSLVVVRDLFLSCYIFTLRHCSGESGLVRGQALCLESLWEPYQLSHLLPTCPAVLIIWFLNLVVAVHGIFLSYRNISWGLDFELWFSFIPGDFTISRDGRPVRKHSTPGLSKVK